ncbi:MAG: TetR/AcrR family transcriptional regulator [Anaerotignum sp.]|jgi:AcrR family transcriptional regulator|nr:TetR/AcrR family transcriptional regulator [Anaerotignum sp.]MCI8867286.1 TetR/AcrR family transcriptional regulator [Anaerotignum sp.]
MIAEKQDRRVKRTKNLMRSALMELMDEKPFSEITAKDVTAKADLNRATFYLHYTNVFALLDEMENEVVEKFAQMLDKLEIRQGEAWEYPLIGHICDYIVENPKLCRCLLLQSRSDRLAGKLTEIMKQKGRKVRQERGVNPESPEAEYIHQFIAYGAMGMVKQWLEEGMPLSREEMMMLAERLTRPILQMLVEG